MASSRILRYLPFSESTTVIQALTYLLCISLFSISFLVFLNSSVSFVITDLIGIRDGVGNIVGTLGFVDEVVALIACPVWGLASDRLGVRNVAVIGYAVIGLALVLFVQARNVYPQLLLARIFFAVGATAAASMVTAILPSLTDESGPPAENLPKPSHQPRNGVTRSLDSQATTTPERFRTSSSPTVPDGDPETESAWRQKAEPSALAGYVGLFTGCGALVALALFLPLPTRFRQIDGVTLGESVAYSFYVVGAVSLLVAVFVFFGLRDLKGENGKGWRMLLGLKVSHADVTALENGAALKQKSSSYWHLLRDSVWLGFTDSQIALGYLGGFVARASSVAISLFIPLFVNSFFIQHGFCKRAPGDAPPDPKECQQAYVLASAISGVSQLIALIHAPIFGYTSSRVGPVNFPIIIATTLGIIGYVALPQLPSPEFKNVDGRGGSPAVFVLAALIGVSQIGAIVCSLGSLGRGVLKADIVNVVSTRDESQETRIGGADGTYEAETAPLLENSGVAPGNAVSRVRLKGSVAGVYSWYGGAAILLLTKLGGYLFDVWSPGAPFYMMAVFNGILLIASLGIDIGEWVRRR